MENGHTGGNDNSMFMATNDNMEQGEEENEGDKRPLDVFRCTGRGRGRGRGRGGRLRQGVFVFFSNFKIHNAHKHKMNSENP